MLRVPPPARAEPGSTRGRRRWSEKEGLWAPRARWPNHHHHGWTVVRSAAKVVPFVLGMVLQREKREGMFFINYLPGGGPCGEGRREVAGAEEPPKGRGWERRAAARASARILQQQTEPR